jgi:single-stranded-DNA-specific exonuclease
LHSRGISTPDLVQSFLEGDPGSDDPFSLLGMPEAVERLGRAISAGELIAVYGDFDADGVTGTALLVLALRELGGTARPYIPHRIEEGYGLNNEALTTLAARGVKVVVTVDCGIRSPDEVAHAMALGMDVIITDHHSIGPKLPEAIAVINPRQPDCPYPYKDLAGVGLSFKLAQALIRIHTQSKDGRDGLEEEDLLGLAALGTVADLVPLTGENRSIVIRGLRQLNTSPRPGLEALMRQAGVTSGRVDTSAIGYGLAPRLNAAGRIAHSKLAYQLLTTEYPGEADRLARELDELNKDRRQMTSDSVLEARRLVQAEGVELPLLFVARPDVPSGVVGLVASRLVDEYYRPAVVVEQGEVESRGSARSIPEFHITQALEKCAHLLVRYGGHRMAAGFTVRTSDLLKLKTCLVEQASQELEGKDLVPVLNVDAQVPLSEMGWQLWESLQKLEPFGFGNREPLFASLNVRLRDSRAVGSDGAHLKLLLSDGDGMWDGIAFRQGDWLDHLPNRVDVAYHLQLNEWRGERRLQLNVQDIRPSYG